MLERITAIVPERVARLPSGTAFDAQHAATAHPERLAHLALRLGWLTPLVAEDTESQQRLGLLNAAGRPLQGGGEDGEGLSEEAEDALA